ncbi:MAG: hypothetical protein H7Y59_10200 [Anaerolineales bacterium]|nr:hypothetical protein [Anaerolineales bacterium]
MTQQFKQVFVILALFSILVLANCSTINQQSTVTSTASPIKTTLTLANTLPSATNTPDIETVIFEESVSPNGEWIAVVSLTTTNTTKDLLFTVSNNQTNQKWIVEQTDVSEIKPSSPTGFIYPYVFKWSQDNNHLYYSHLSTGGDGCFGLRRPGGLDLKRFDLSRGNMVAIQKSGGTWMALSPDETILAYASGWNGGITILEVEKGKELILSLPQIKNEQNMITATSYLYWAPDGKTLIYSHMVGVCDIKIWYSYIIQINPENGRQTVLVDHDDRGFIPVEWNSQDKILLIDNDNINWWLNPSTQEITSAD